MHPERRPQVLSLLDAFPSDALLMHLRAPRHVQRDSRDIVRLRQKHHRLSDIVGRLLAPQMRPRRRENL